MNLRSLNSRLAARLGTKQVEAVVRADLAASEVDAQILKLWARMLKALGPNPNAVQIRVIVHQFFKALVPATANSLHDSLVSAARWGHTTTADVLTATLPREVLATAVEVKESRVLFEDFVNQPGAVALSYDPQTGGMKARDRAGRLREPVRSELSPERQRQIFRDLLFNSPSVDTIRRIVFQPTNGVNFAQRLNGAANLGDLDALASGFALGFSQGKTIQQIAKDMEPLVNGVRSAARRIARTDGMRVINRVNWEAQNAMGDVVAGWSVSAQLDQNSRPWHAARNGQIYYKNPKPGQKGLRQMPHPPMEPEDPAERPSGTPERAHNCRCILCPVISPPQRPLDRTTFQRDRDSLIPDPDTYQTWFRQADEQRRKIAVGARKYLFMLDQLQREPEWVEFVDPETGGLLSLDELKRETVAERTERVSQVRGMIAERRRDLERAALVEV